MQKNSGLLRKQKLIVYMSRPQKSFKRYPKPQNNPLGPQKVKKGPKISQNQLSELEETKKMKVVQLRDETP